MRPVKWHVLEFEAGKTAVTNDELESWRPTATEGGRPTAGGDGRPSGDAANRGAAYAGNR